MLPEVQHAVSTLVGALFPPLPSSDADVFASTLSELLHAHCSRHWYPQDSLRGSAFRALIHPDPLVMLAAKSSGVADPQDIFSRISAGFLGSCWTLWIDPGLVSCRTSIGGPVQQVWRSSSFILPVSHAVPIVDPASLRAPSSSLKEDIECPSSDSFSELDAYPSRDKLDQPAIDVQDNFDCIESRPRPFSRSSSASSSAQSCFEEDSVSTAPTSTIEDSDCFTDIASLDDVTDTDGAIRQPENRKIATLQSIRRLPSTLQDSSHIRNVSSTTNESVASSAASSANFVNTRDHIQSFSNGNVGVLGGGVPLGMAAKSNTANGSKVRNMKNTAQSSLILAKQPSQRSRRPRRSTRSGGHNQVLGFFSHELLPGTFA